MKRDLNESVITENTFVDVDVLSTFLSERSLEIKGDVFEEYAEQQSKLLEVAVTAIRYGLRNEINNIDHQTKSHILYLEERVKELETENKLQKDSKGLESKKPLHTKERETLLKLVIGMAVSGYSYDPQSKIISDVR